LPEMPTQTSTLFACCSDPETDNKDLGLGLVPEFPLALRSKLLGGPSTYDIRKNPLYEHYFERLEDFWVGIAFMYDV